MIYQPTKVIKMNPVRKGAGNGQLSQDFSPEPKKAGEAKKGKVCRENDSSDESQSDEVLGKSEKPRAVRLRIFRRRIKYPCEDSGRLASAARDQYGEEHGQRCGACVFRKDLYA